jgi:hypothetical protein
MRAMLDTLVASLPPHRHQALDEERRRLDATIATHYVIPSDLALAGEADSQGLGGGARTPAALGPDAN